MIDQRLQCVASMVRDGAKLADVGTDHAYLPVFLMQSGRIVQAIAADIGEGPAATAMEHITQAGLQDRIAVRVCDGLCGIAPSEVTDIVIAGMGGETMIHILKEAPWTKNPRFQLVLQPMTKTVELRRWLYEQGFEIERERLIADGRHLYAVMAVRFTDAPCPTAPEAPYVGALESEEGQPYFKKQRDYLRKRIGGLRAAGNEQEAQALEDILTRLQTYIKDE